MVRWTSVELPPRPTLPEPPASVRAIVIDPKLFIVEEEVIAAHVPAAERLLGGAHDWHIRLPSGDFLLSAKTDRNYRWWVRLYGEVKLIGRCVILGHDDETDYFADATVRHEQLRNWVDFRGPDDKSWVRYSDRHVTAASGRPSNVPRRLREIRTIAGTQPSQRGTREALHAIASSRVQEAVGSA